MAVAGRGAVGAQQNQMAMEVVLLAFLLAFACPPLVRGLCFELENHEPRNSTDKSSRPGGCGGGHLRRGSGESLSAKLVGITNRKKEPAPFARRAKRALQEGCSGAIAVQ